MICHMEFECKLAHQPINVKTIGGFNSIKELYERIGRTFNVPSNEILFCTLNSRDPRNMDNLLANYLSVGDSINAHLIGNSKHLNLAKQHEQLGLTITDNGHGRAFVKRIKDNDIKLKSLIEPGDHIASINGKSVVGMRHFEVAKALRQIPLNSSFELEIIKPLIGESQDYDVNDLIGPTDISITRSDDDLNDHKNLQDNKPFNHLRCHQSLLETPFQAQKDPRVADIDNNYFSLEDLADSSLPLDRILSPSSANSSIRMKTNESQPNVYKMVLKNINSILESFIGIDDHTLAVRIYRLARDHDGSIEDFSKAIQLSELSVFNFGIEIERHLWNSVNKAL